MQRCGSPQRRDIIMPPDFCHRVTPEGSRGFQPPRIRTCQNRGWDNLSQLFPNLPTSPPAAVTSRPSPSRSQVTDSRRPILSGGDGDTAPKTLSNRLWCFNARTPETFFKKSGSSITWAERKSGLQPGETLDLTEQSLTPAAEGFPTAIYESMKTGLATCGLLESEAHAMVRTW
jgi:hypothetical protein